MTNHELYLFHYYLQEIFHQHCLNAAELSEDELIAKAMAASQASADSDKQRKKKKKKNKKIVLLKVGL